MTKGGVAQRVVALLLAVGAAAASCEHAADPALICRAELAAKGDAVTSCIAAYVERASVTNAKQVVSAYAARGDDALTALLAAHPVDPIGAELWHRRGFRLRGDDDIASIQAFQHALALRGADLEGQVRELLALAERRWARMEVREELALRARAFEAATELGDPVVLAHVRVGIAIAFDSVGEIAAAERALGTSIDQLPPDDGFLPPALLCAGTLQLELGHPHLAMQLLERVMASSDEIAKREGHWQVIEAAFAQQDLGEAARLIAGDTAHGPHHEYYVARLAFARGDFAAAAQAIDRALAGPASRVLPTYEAFHGAILAKLGRHDAAIAEWNRAIAESEQELGTLALDELKQWLQRSSEFRAPYEHLFAEYARENKPLEALQVAQRATARAYLDGLASESSTTTSKSDDLAEIARATGVRVEALHVMASSLRTSSSAAEMSVGALVAGLADQSVWTYFEADGELWLVALAHGQAGLYDLGATSEMRPLLDRAATLDEAALAELGERLAPEAGWLELAPKDVLHIVTDDALARVPFAALVRDHKRWIEQTAISYVPSASVLAALYEPRVRGGARVVVGDPDGSLPGARSETIATAAALESVPLVGRAATRDTVLAAKHAGVLAIAAHAEATPDGARLHLADGDVTPAQIVDSAVAPELVVLSSCSSGAVDVDAWGALAGAFIAAGSANVIASRWSLEDSIGSELVAELYRNGVVDHPALALAIAQRHAIEHHLPASAWAALVALGTGERSRNLLAERSGTDEHTTHVP